MLHIFEERYKQMIKYCLDDEVPFGVVLIRNGREALGPLAEPYSIGCTAQIVEVQELNEGRMNLTTVGERRFRIISLDYNSPYLIGNVADYPWNEGNQELLLNAAGNLAPKVVQYMQILNKVEGFELDPEKLPEDPLILAHLSAVLLQIPPERKQDLLSSASVLDLLEESNQVYRREIAFLRAMVDRLYEQKHKDINLN